MTLSPLLITAVVFLCCFRPGGPAGVRVCATPRPRQPPGSTCSSASAARRMTRAADILQQLRLRGRQEVAAWKCSRPSSSALQKLFEQADCHIKPSTLFGIGLLLACVGVTLTLLTRIPIIFAPLNGLVMFSLPFALAAQQTPGPPGQVRRAAARRPGAGGPGAACRAIAWRRHARGGRGNARPDLRGVRPRLRGAEPGHPHRGRPARRCASACPTSICASS